MRWSSYHAEPPSASRHAEDVKYPAVRVQLIRTGGNSIVAGFYTIMSKIVHALREQVSDEAADEFYTEAMNCNTQTALIQLAKRTVTVQ